MADRALDRLRGSGAVGEDLAVGLPHHVALDAVLPVCVAVAHGGVGYGRSHVVGRAVACDARDCIGPVVGPVGLPAGRARIRVDGLPRGVLRIDGGEVCVLLGVAVIADLDLWQDARGLVGIGVAVHAHGEGGGVPGVERGVVDPVGVGGLGGGGPRAGPHRGAVPYVAVGAVLVVQGGLVVGTLRVSVEVEHLPVYILGVR